MNYHTEPLFKISHVLKIEDQYKVNVQIFMHQLKHYRLPKSFSILTYFTAERPPTRQQQLANCNRFRTTFSSLLPYHKFPRLWNELEPNFREIDSIQTFKKRVIKKQIESYSHQIICTNRRCGQCFGRN
jgi:hypothetical protein